MTESSDIWAPWRKVSAPPPYGPFLCRIENTAGRGQPDVVGCFRGVTAWIELKVIARGQKIKFRPAQPAWIRQWVASGGRVWVLVRKDDALRLFRWNIVNNPTWEAPGCMEIEFKTPFDWNMVERFIFDPLDKSRFS